MRQSTFVRWVGGVFGILVAAYLILPAFAVVPMALSSGRFLEFPPPGFSVQWVTEFFTDEDWMQALGRSIVVALCTAVIAVPIGTLASFAILRSSTRVSSLLQPLVMMPLAVPVVVSGFAIYVGTLVLRLPGGLWLVVLGHVGLAIPFVVTTVLASMRTFDLRLLSAARVHGASPARAFLRVLVPVIAPGIGAATLIALMTSLDESVIALFIAGDTAPTLPVMMFSSITYSLNPLVPVAATVLTTVTLGLLVGSLLLVRLGRRRTRGTR